MLDLGKVIHHERYRVESLLGQGGMGAVYKASDLNLGIPVAIKENLDISPETRKQFSREATLLATLSHPNLPRVIDYFYVPDQGQYLIMDYVEGEDLQSMLERLGHLPERQALVWIGQIVDALVYLHDQPVPVVHRDIKPGNIKIRSDGRAVLVDFGIAKLYNPHLATTIGAKAVTPGYSPPEQYGGGQTDPRSDIYALGATLYHMLTGKTPPESVQRVADVAAMPPPRQINDQISPAVEGVIVRSVELSTERRFQTANEMRSALAKASPLAGQQDAPAAGGPKETAAISSDQREGVQAASSEGKKKLPIWVFIAGAAVLGCILLAVAGTATSTYLLAKREAPTQQAELVPTFTTVVVAAPTDTTQLPVLAAPTLEPTESVVTSTVEATSPVASVRPTSYQVIGGLVSPDGQLVRATAYKDGYGYVLTRKGTLHVYDLTSLSVDQDFIAYREPVASLSLPNGNSLLLRGEHLYVGGNAGITVLSVQQASEPVVITTAKDASIYNLVAIEQYLIALGDRKVIFYDLTIQDDPLKVSSLSFDLGYMGMGAALYEKYLYLSLFVSGEKKSRGLLKIYDFSDPARPKEVQSIDPGEVAYHMFAADNLLIRCTTNDVEVWDLAEKEKPHFLNAKPSQGRVCLFDQQNIVTNGAIFTLLGSEKRLDALQSFDVTIGAEGGNTSQSEAFPYGSAASGQFVLLTQAGRVLILGVSAE